jgi:membrane-bound lytic murein transglycosylase D
MAFSVKANDTLTAKVDTSFSLEADDAVLQMIDQLLADRYYNSFQFAEDTIGELASDSFPTLNDSILAMRMAELDAQTPFDLRYNQYSKAFINLYVNKKRELSRNVLSLAPRYFPMIEETLDEYQLPLELKYLAVVESALNPSARSRVGAQGLWQFMYSTGRMYGLKVTSYYDERMDPIKATRAACQYLSDLYSMYGDWSLVLAAYNSGPGNVNKAIRRSGGIKDYWKIRRFLPRETRGYVPAFIAVNYMMQYPEEHNIYPKKIRTDIFNTDTILLSNALSFEQLSDFLQMPKEEIAFFNPQYKLDFIPEDKTAKPLCLPTGKLGVYLCNEQAIYAEIRKKEIEDSIAGVEKEPALPPSITHYVRSGEFLGYIANKYKVSVRSIMQWNNMYSTRINPGDKLIIYTSASTANKASEAAPPQQTTQNKPKEVDSGKYQIHTVRSGDTLWDIAKYYDDITVNDLKRLNSGMDFRRLKPGMQVKIKQIG